MRTNLNKAIVSLSFDDGRRDSYDVFMKLLKPMNIPATINIPTGYIEIGFSDPLDIGYNGLMSKEQLDEIEKNTIFEIASHGYMHNNSDDDIQMGVLKLRQWYPDIRDVGFASPHSELKDKDVSSKMDFYEKLGICYVRLGRNFTKKNLPKRLLSMIASKTGRERPYVSCYKSSLNNGSKVIIHAIPIIKTTCYGQIKAIIDYSVKNKKWCVLEIHGIDTKDSAEYKELFCWDSESFVMLCKYLVDLRFRGLIELKKMIDVIE